MDAPVARQNKVEEFEQALLLLDRVSAMDLLRSELPPDGSPIPMIERLVVPTLEHMGACWEKGTLALAQIYMGGKICEELLDALLPPLASERRHQPRMAIAVLEDFHVLGKRIVQSALRASGYELLDYGAGVSAKDLAQRAIQDRVEIMLISTLMFHSAIHVRQVRDELDRQDARPMIVVGGAPFLFDNSLWIQVGADAMGRNAAEAIRIIRHLAKESL